MTSAKSNKQGRLSTPKSQLRTILPFVAASGRVWMIVLIYKDVSKVDSKKVLTLPVTTELRQTRSIIPTYYAMTANGFITSELWKQIISVLLEQLSAFKKDQPGLLLLDRHTTHILYSPEMTYMPFAIIPLFGEIF